MVRVRVKVCFGNSEAAATEDTGAVNTMHYARLGLGLRLGSGRVSVTAGVRVMVRVRVSVNVRVG